MHDVLPAASVSTRLACQRLAGSADITIGCLHTTPSRPGSPGMALVDRQPGPHHEPLVGGPLRSAANCRYARGRTPNSSARTRCEFVIVKVGASKTHYR